MCFKCFCEESKCKLHKCCNSCTFCVFERATTKERCKSQCNLRKWPNKACERSFFCKSVSFCPSCDKCPQCCRRSACGGPTAKILASVGPKGFKSKGSIDPERGVQSSIWAKTSSHQGTSDKERICQSPQEQLPAGGIAFPPSETSYRKCTGSVLSGVLQQAFHCSQTKSKMAANPRSQCPQPVPQGQNLQNGNPRVHSSVTTTRRVGDVARLQRRLLSHHYQSKLKEVPPIDFLELKAVLLALKAFKPLSRGRVVLVATDNTTVVAYINKEGGMGNLPESTSHSGPAQCDSRQTVPTQWSLHPDVCSDLPQVASSQGGPVCDEVQLQTASVCVPDPKAWAVDALTLSWEDLDLYAFPPVPLLTNVLTKALSHRCKRMIIVAPGWLNMPWFWDLVEMSSQIPVCLPNRPDLLSQPFNGNLHRDQQNLNLDAWLLEPKISGNKGSLTKWQRELKLLKDGLLDLSMKQSGPFLFDGIRRIRWTSMHHL